MRPVLLRSDSRSESRSYQRSVNKSGFCAIRKKRRVPAFTFFSADLFTSLVDLRWRWIMLIYTLSFISTWFIFGLVWWVIAYAHGDLKMSPYENTEPEPCVTLIDDMISAFLFSMETQYTTGFGTRAPTPQCPEAVFLLCVQSIFGLLLQSTMVGVVFAKLARPKARSQAIIFSEKAVICLRDGRLCLIFRLADVRKSRLVGCTIRAWILRHELSQEGEVLPYYQTQLKVTVEEGGQDFFLLWPVTVVHKIDPSSPLYDLTAQNLLGSQFEVVVSLVCTVETTGQQTEARCSYIPSDIHWGHRFKNIIVRNEENGLHIDYAHFDETICVDTATCSARQLDSLPLKNSSKNRKFLLLNEKHESLTREKESCVLWCTSEA